MKLLNKKQKNNKGFSLVELIVVIAIMVVLVAVLAPVFTRYIESSRRSTDVQNATALKEAVMADVSDEKIVKPQSGDTITKTVAVTDDLPSSVGEVPKAKGDKVKKGDTFTYEYNFANNTCTVYLTSDSDKHDLSTDGGAQWYKSND